MNFIRKQRYIVMLFCDLITVALIYAFTLSIAEIDNKLFNSSQIYFNTILWLLLIVAVLNMVFGQYKVLWIYAGIRAFFVNAFIFGSAFTLFTFIVNTELFHIKFSVSLIFFTLTCMMIIPPAIRFVYRMANRSRFNIKSETSKQTVLVVGAGLAAEILLTEIKNNSANNYKVVAMVDDDPKKIGMSFNSIKVMGDVEETPDICEKFNIETIIIAIPSMNDAERKRILDICSQTPCKMKILPSLFQISLSETSLFSQIKEVEVEDLLGREPISLLTENYLQNKKVIITGGGGSIGSELCRQIAKQSPKSLYIIDIYENNAYEIEQELKFKYKNSLEIITIIASVRDKGKMEKLFSEIRPEYVFHAAAHKHVPLMESCSEEAIKNNVMGTLNIAELSGKYGCEKFILISTDKAVNPTNVMGATKRAAEKIIMAMDGKYKTVYAAVRFGNVLGSNGSVLPLFKKQLAAGGPLTVTHKDIIRYFMTISEAVCLVLQAGYIARSGSIYILDMGQPVKIFELAKQFLKLSGYIPFKDVEIIFTGLRPGEKLYEELLMAEEGILKTENDRIFIGKQQNLNKKEVFDKVEKLIKTAEQNDSEKSKLLLKDLVETYKENSEVNNI